MLKVIEATASHAEELTGNLRIEDQRELDLSGTTLEDSLSYSEHSFVIQASGRPIAIWGYSRHELGCVPWFLGTDAVLQHVKPLLFLGHTMTTVLLEKYTRLFNVVHEENSRHIRWLRYMGFTLVPLNEVEAEAGVTAEDYPYIYFYKERFSYV